MGRPKFSLNVLIFIIMLFSAAFLFVSVYLYDFADRSAMNEIYPLGDTGLYIRYATHIDSGLYDGDETWARCLSRGMYGYNQGAWTNGESLIVNEYHRTKYGFMTCDLVKIDLHSFEKELLEKDTILLGESSSGKLLLAKGAVMPNWFTDTNSLYPLYMLTSGRTENLKAGPEAVFLDPENGEMISEGHDKDLFLNERQAYYLGR